MSAKDEVDGLPADGGRGGGRSWLTLTVAALGLGASLSLCVTLHSRETRLIDAEFRLDAEEQARLVEQEFRQAIGVVHALRAFFIGSDQVTRDQFALYAGHLLERFPAIQALEWIPLVTPAQRESHEQQTRQEGFPEYEIRERTDSEQSLRAGERDEYFPVHFAEPYRGNEAALGFDLGSEPVRREVLRQVFETRRAAVSGPVLLVQETAGQSGVLVCDLVPRKRTTESASGEDEESPLGYVVCVLRAGAVAEAALGASVEADICLQLIDETQDGTEQTLFVHPCETQNGLGSAGGSQAASSGQAMRHVVPVAVPGRKWKVVCMPRSPYVSDRRSVAPLVALLAGVVMAVLLTMNVGALVERHRRVEETSRRQTGQLNDANRSLNREVTVRQKAEEMFRGLLESVPDAVIIVDQNGNITLANAVALELFGYSREELLGQPVEVIVPPRLRDGHRALRKQYHAQPQVRPMGAGRELVGIHRDGSEFPAEISLGPLPSQEGPLVIGILRDLTERKRLAAERRRREDQLIAAQRIQQHLLPETPPSLPGFDMAGALLPVEFAAGDLFDFVPLSDGTTGIVVGDVAGHGFAPALLMASTRALLRGMAQNGDEIGRIVERTNAVLCGEMELDRFVTMLFARLDPVRRTLDYVNAGHPTGFVIGIDGDIRFALKSKALPLGVVASTAYVTVGPHQLQDDDVVLLLTDGALEAGAHGGRQFGSKRAVAVVHEHRQLSSREIIDRLLQAIRDFAPEQSLADDVTLVVIKVGAAQNGEGPQRETTNGRE